MDGTTPGREGSPVPLGDTDQEMQNRVNKMEGAIAQLQAELEWVKVALQGRVPAQAPENTRPPILGPVLVAVISAVAVIAASKPWA